MDREVEEREVKVKEKATGATGKVGVSFAPVKCIVSAVGGHVALRVKTA